MTRDPQANLVLRILIILMACAGACLPCYALAAYLEFVNPSPKMSEVTRPLKPEVVQDLCAKFSLPVTDRRCQTGAVVYSPDFADVIEYSLRPGLTSYTDVQSRIGSYKYRCESTITEKDGHTYFTCDYDFQGDRVYPVTVFFTGHAPAYGSEDSDGIVERVIPFSGGS